MSTETDETTFNATLTLYYLRRIEDGFGEPDNKIDRNIVLTLSKLSNMLKLKDNNYGDEIIKKLLRNETVEGDLVRNFNFNMDFSKSHILSLLHYFDYITIKNYYLGSIEYGITNYAWRQLYNDYYFYNLHQRGIDRNVSKEIKALECLCQDSNIGELCKVLECYLQMQIIMVIP